MTATALRETLEELPGLEVNRISILGRLSPVPSKGLKHNVYPIVAFIEGDLSDLEHLQRNPDEVSAVFSIPVTELLDPRLREMQTFSRAGISVPSWRPPLRISDRFPDVKVWGLTAVSFTNAANTRTHAHLCALFVINLHSIS